MPRIIGAPTVPSPISGEGPQVQYQEDFFAYSTEITTVPASGSQVANLQIEADSYFKWIKGTFYAFINGGDADTTNATRFLPAVTVQVTDSGSGRDLYNVPIFVQSAFGTGEEPFIQPIARIFLPRSSIQFTFNNLDAGDDWDIQLSLVGVKGFKSN